MLFSSPKNRMNVHYSAVDRIHDGSKMPLAKNLRAYPIQLRIFAWLLICIALLPVGIAESTDCPDQIQGYWKLDENTTGSYSDEIANNDGVCAGSCPVPTNGVVGRAQFFDGNFDNVTIGADASFDWSASHSFTIELWLRRNFGTISGGLEVFIGRADVGGLNWYIGIDTAGQAQAMLKASDGSGPGALTGTKDLRSSSSDPVWHHVALVRNASLSRTTLYVDGEVADSQNFSYAAGFASNTAALALGSLNGNNLFNGGLDEVAIYDRALDVDEMKSHYYLAFGYCNFYDSPVKIMPLGDSITAGSWAAGLPPVDERVSYRLDLWDSLQSNLYWSDFIGSQQNGSGIDPDFDDDHAGFGGISDNWLYTLLATGRNEVPPAQQITAGPYLEYYPADILLLHIGTNYPDTSPDQVEDILNQVDLYSKNITVVLARIIRRLDDLTVIPQFNDNIEDLANTRIAQGDKIIMLDIEDGAGFIYTEDPTQPYTSGDMYDFLHPNPSGYNKMAGTWFTVLEALLPQSEVPLITSSPSLSATTGLPYTYQIGADGLPSPTYQVVSGPSGMSVDALSGLVQWTPDTAGNYPVTVRALNWTGQHQQIFTISVGAGNGGGGGGGGGGCFISVMN
jgi:lysophospholipase L1-like esterase